jgi:hypothetical protein
LHLHTGLTAVKLREAPYEVPVRASDVQKFANFLLLRLRRMGTTPGEAGPWRSDARGF